VEHPERPLLIFDGDCGFCRAWVAKLRRITRDHVDYAPSQEVAPRFPEIPAERLAESVVLVEPDGRVAHGAEAVFRSIAHVPGHGGWLWLYRRVPGFRPMSEWLYRWVARNRARLPAPRGH
jgi:predicted DCC family thiol-disulfide oxidoreductase YuxK